MQKYRTPQVHGVADRFQAAEHLGQVIVGLMRYQVDAAAASASDARRTPPATLRRQWAKGLHEVAGGSHPPSGTQTALPPPSRAGRRRGG
jgi:hypothetical protein